MKAFLLKYKWRIIFWLIFLSVMLYFAPKQNDYYLDTDIKHFKTHYLSPILFWAGVTISILLFLILFFKTKFIKQSALSFINATIMIAFFLFIFQDLFLAGALFLNRQIKIGTVQETYLVNYWVGAEKNKKNFVAHDISTKQTLIDPKLTNLLSQSVMKQNDTVTLTFDKGLLGIAFTSQPFRD